MTVSIIVPVFNARKYLARTARDLLRQTYHRIEVIFVDDGSTDGSGRMLDRLAGYDERVCVLHQKNGGTACARNAGLAAASGAYIMFMDDDDRVPKGYVQEYVTEIERTGADLVIGGYRRISPEGKTLFTRRLAKSRRINPEDGKDDSRGGSRRNVMDMQRGEAQGSREPVWPAFINVSPWAKIYRRRFVERCGAHFLEYPYGEDIFFQMMLQAGKPLIAYSDSVSYGWVDHKESISNTVHKGIREEADIFPMLDKVLEVHPERGDLFRYFLYRHCAYHLYVSGREADRVRLEEEFRRCRQWLRENDLLPVISPFSCQLRGEILRDRVAVQVIRMTSRLHLEHIFARIYGRG